MLTTIYLANPTADLCKNRKELRAMAEKKVSDDGYAYARGSSRSKSAGEGGGRRHTRQERVDEVERLEGDVVLLMKTIDQKQLKLQSASGATFMGGPRLQR